MFFQVDDQLPVNGKVKRLMETVLDDDLYGPAALALWTLAGADSQASLSEGVVSRADCARLMMGPRLGDTLAVLLVEVGLWHVRGHQCPRCPQPPEGAYVYHDWAEMKYQTAEQTKTARGRRKDLKDRALIEGVWARDAIDPAVPTVAWCRYCGEVVKKYDRRSPVELGVRPHLDHIDPTKARDPENVVVACGACNQRKGARTPAQAGMELLPPPPRPYEGPKFDPKGGRFPRSPFVAGPVSPGPRVAGLSASSPCGTDAGTGSPERVDGAEPTGPVSGTSGRDQRLVTDQTNVPELSPPARGPGQGQGQGLGRGVGKGPVPGEGPGEPGPFRSGRRRRRRGRGRGGGSGGAPGVAGPGGGAVPVVPVAGEFGSPWHGWRGPPSEVVDTDCERHGLPEPCRKCASEEEL